MGDTRDRPEQTGELRGHGRGADTGAQQEPTVSTTVYVYQTSRPDPGLLLEPAPTLTIFPASPAEAS